MLRSWRLIEAAQAIDNALPQDKSVLNGQNEATYLAQQASKFGFNIMRLFGLADVNYGEGSPLQPSPGESPASAHCKSGASMRVNFSCELRAGLVVTAPKLLA